MTSLTLSVVDYIMMTSLTLSSCIKPLSSIRKCALIPRGSALLCSDSAPPTPARYTSEMLSLPRILWKERKEGGGKEGRERGRRKGGGGEGREGEGGKEEE